MAWESNEEHQFSDGLLAAYRVVKKYLPQVYLKVFKLNNFPSDFLMTVLPIIGNYPS
jgi:hypothetical protein